MSAWVSAKYKMYNISFLLLVMKKKERKTESTFSQYHHKHCYQTSWFNWFNPLKCFFGSEGHVALDRNPGSGYDTLLLRMIPGDLLSAFPHRQFHTLPGLLDSWAALPNSNPNAWVPMQGGSLYHFYDGLWYDPAERRTHDLPCEIKHLEKYVSFVSC